jgi:hypothetical protein
MKQRQLRLTVATKIAANLLLNVVQKIALTIHIT